MILFCSRFSHCGAVLGGVKAEPCGWPRPALTPPAGDTDLNSAGSRRGNRGEGFGGGLAWVVTGQFFLILLTNQLVIERTFEYNGGMELGDHDSATDAALDALNEALTT